jgi:transcriptional regulator with XRE-family HTH domain
MNREEFGTLVEALRKEHLDEDNKKWTQQKLAEEARLSEQMIGTIERGSKATLDAETLLRLAQALSLTSNERKKFFAAASGISIEQISRGDQDRQSGLQEMVAYLKQMYAPAFLLDSFGDIIALNRGCAILYDDPDLHTLQQSSRNSGINFNLLIPVFAPEFKQQRASNQEIELFQVNTIAFFRTLTFERRCHPYFVHILDQMRRISPPFKRLWRDVDLRENDYFMDKILLKVQHRQLGSLCQLACSITAVIATDELRLFTFVPMDEATFQAFQKLFLELKAHEIIQLLPKWPQKEFATK